MNQPIGSILVLTVIVGCVSCETCYQYIVRMKDIDKGQITAKENVIHIEASVTGNDTYQVHFSCRGDYKLMGPEVVVCHQNGSWSQKIPECIEQCTDLSSVENIEINAKERIINATVKIMCDPDKFTYYGPSELSCKHGGWVTNEGQKLSDMPRCVKIVVPKYTSWKVPVVIAGCCFGTICILIIWISICVWQRRKQGKVIDKEVKKNPQKLDSLFCVKVWTSDRQKRKLIVASDLETFRTEVCLQFGIDGRFVLEEDGTDIETDIALLRCKDNTLMILGKGEYWQMSRSKQYKNAEDCSAFQIFTPDRKKSAMVLCYSMSHLSEQVLHMFGYLPCYICLEEDGTVLETDEELMAFSGNRLIAMKEGSIWTQPRSDNSLSDHFSTSNHKYMFNVWSEDGKKRKNIFATNVVELHHAVALEFCMQPPVEILTLDGTLIFDDTLLCNHRNSTLIVKEIRHNRKLNLRNPEPFQDYSVYSA